METSSQCDELLESSRGYLGRFNGMSSENHNLHISINEDIAERSGYHKNPCKYKGYCTDKKRFVLGKLKCSFFSSKLVTDIYGVEMYVIAKVYSQNGYVSYFDLVGYKSTTSQNL